MSQYPTKLSQLSNLIEHVAETAAKVIPRISAYKPGVDEACIPFIDDFVLYVTIRSYTTVPELMMSLIYLSWFRNRLPPSVTGRSSTPHRVFLAALMLAHKVHNDDSANNTCWADLSVIPECSFAGFSKVEVNLMERQFLAGLDWNLHINVDVQSWFGIVGVVFASIGGQAQHRVYRTALPASHQAILKYSRWSNPTCCNVLPSKTMPLVHFTTK
ncbi:conserved hypothetical protein [Pyrenophora tritici-repentis Pt-1C-BFP]|uniref:Cyclin N-terminal domain-containing protein n=1 Tax=Pyrenophora tritici-repentis (strain Pt-1C-BFP) TaxID=426418 RepID=B2WP83_PYRTR|nr:uncharacterized protein PTRG_11793 [Pyrenophora tritici-repentis Pt-1C-BFP]EDU45949.1 conserved hypothetical protein [Pyrenophora tritici-repentis Pt-1C-BFP]